MDNLSNNIIVEFTNIVYLEIIILLISLLTYFTPLNNISCDKDLRRKKINEGNKKYNNFEGERQSLRKESLTREIGV